MPRNKQFDQKEVLQKAIQVFWKKGYHATSVSNLIKELGISKSSLYDTFGDKKKLYEAALKAYRVENLQFVQTQLAAIPSARAGLQNLFYTVLLGTLNDPEHKGCFVVNCTTEYLPNEPHIIVELLDNKNTFQKIVSATLQRGIEQGEFSKTLDVNAVAVYLYTFFGGLQVSTKVNQDPIELRKTIALGLKVLEL